MAGFSVDFPLINSRGMLREHFALLDEGVEAVAERCEHLGVISADVFTAAVNGDVLVHLVRLDGEVGGFMVSHPTTQLGGESNLHVWMLYLRPGIPDVMDEVVEELDFLAREQGCTGVTFNTTRPAWERRLARFGYKVESIALRKDLGGLHG